jgi:4'-phosphopantetheinyl transferase EntD
MVTTSLVDDLPSRTEMTAVEHEMRATVIQALRPCRDALGLGKDVFLAVLSAADQGKPWIHPEEERILSPRACTKKRTEFVLGRTAVRQALRELGEKYAPVLRGGYGEPLWPDGILGSITHCWPWAVALVVRSGRPFAIGIDLESLEKTGRADISRVICTAAELDWVRHGSSSNKRLAMIFSAKETVYKGFHRFCRQYIDFQDVELSWLTERQSFAVSFLGGTKLQFPSLRGCEVHCRCFDDFVFSCMIYEAAGETA